MRTYKDAKAMAKSLRDSLAASSVSLSHSSCLEIVAKQFGFVDWNTLSAKLAVALDQGASPNDAENAVKLGLANGACPKPRHAAAEQMSCSFCGKSQDEVWSLIEGGCSSRGISPCVFICNECVTFCAQINAERVDSTASPQSPSYSS